MAELKIVSVRLAEERSLFSPSPIRTQEDAVKLMGRELSQYDREVLCVLNLNTQGQAINMNIASMGTINASLAVPREIFKASILSNAASIILMHNHPSGDATPSAQDHEITRRLVKCGNLLGIRVLDHLIVGGGSGTFYSFLEQGAMPQLDQNDFVHEPAVKEKKMNYRIRIK